MVYVPGQALGWVGLESDEPPDFSLSFVDKDIL